MTTELLIALAEKGLLGLLLVLSFSVIFYLYKEVRQSRYDRIADMKEIWQADIKYREELKSLVQNILDIIRRTESK